MAPQKSRVDSKLKVLKKKHPDWDWDYWEAQFVSPKDK